MNLAPSNYWLPLLRRNCFFGLQQNLLIPLSAGIAAFLWEINSFKHAFLWQLQVFCLETTLDLRRRGYHLLSEIKETLCIRMWLGPCLICVFKEGCQWPCQLNCSHLTCRNLLLKLQNKCSSKLFRLLNVGLWSNACFMFNNFICTANKASQSFRFGNCINLGCCIVARVGGYCEYLFGLQVQVWRC